MWEWVVVAWCGVAVVLAVMHHRLRSVQPTVPEEVEQFLLRLESELARIPGVTYRGLLPGEFRFLLSVHGQETPVDLHELFRRAEAFPQDFQKTLMQLIAEIEERGLDHVSDHEFGSVATVIMPQVRSNEWIEQQGRFGGQALVSRRLSEDLSVVYVIDEPQSMVFVCRAHLTRWRRSEQDIHRLALDNLGRLAGGRNLHVDPESQPLLLQIGDGYDAARVLLLDQAEGLLVAMPDRDTLWVGREGRGRSNNLASLMSAAESMARSAPHPVSDRVYRVRDGYLEPVAR
jgi:uncharacterized protein YtpQ (UPF0354 family)